MKIRAALLCATFLFLAACGGGGDSGNAGQPQPSSSGTGGSGGTSPSASSTPSAGDVPSSSGSTCQSQPVVGGDLFVVDNAPVRVTLLANGGMTGGTFTFLYDNVFGTGTNNQQDKWGAATPFRPSDPVGTFTDVQLQPPPSGQPAPSNFPKGIPVELWVTTDDGNQPGPANSSSTASIGKDLLGHDQWHTASVVYASNNTATVTFFSSVGGPAFKVGLTNVSGKASTCSF